MQDGIKLRMSKVATETDQRSVALQQVFGPAVAESAAYEPHHNDTLFRRVTELEAIAGRNREMAITPRALELASFTPEFSAFTAGYLHCDAAQKVAVFSDPLLDLCKQKVEDQLGLKLLSVVSLERRQPYLRGDRDVQTSEDLAGLRLRILGADAWQFHGTAPGA